MIVNEHIRDYLFSLEKAPSDRLIKLEEQALKKHVPIIRRDTQDLLKFLLKKEKPEADTAQAFLIIKFRLSFLISTEQPMMSK